MLCVDFFVSLEHTKFDKGELQTLFVCAYLDCQRLKISRMTYNFG
jgi:hypothetical protein